MAVAALGTLGVLCLPGVVAALVWSGFFVNVLLLKGNLSLLRPGHYMLAFVAGLGLWTAIFALAHELTRALVFGTVRRSME